MQKIRQLAHSIFFKIFLAFLLLSFALFGISNFLVNGSDSWVAKVGGKTISYGKLMKSMQKDREAIIQASGNNPKALEYLNSTQFQSDVLGRLVNQIIIEKLRNHFGVDASKTIILEAVARDPQFHNKEGKFDHAAFKQFLAQNGFDEDRYVRAVQDEIVGTMIISSVSLASPVDNKTVAQITDLKTEKRLADVIYITDKNLGKIDAPSDKELMNFYEKNKQKFHKTETRHISYLSFSKKELGKLNEDEMQKKLSAIEDSLLTSNSLTDTAKKFNLKVSDLGEIGANHLSNNIKALDDFVKNAFAAKEKEVSKLFYSKSNDSFYAVKVEKIDAARQKTFEEAKFLITDLYTKEYKHAKLREFAQKIADEIKLDPTKSTQIVAKYGLRTEKNKEFPRFGYITFQGQTIPYASQFNDDLFGITLNQATNAMAVSDQEYKIGILRAIKKFPASASQIEAAKRELEKDYRTEILQEFNKFLQKKYPIKINEKFLNRLASDNTKPE